MRTRHGQATTPTPLYSRWKNLRRNHPDADPAWDAFPAFERWAKTHSYRPGLWLAKRDPACPHGPGNSRWVAPGNPDGNLRNRIPVTAFGETKHLAAWVRDRRCKVGYAALRTRLQDGEPPESAITRSSKRRPVLTTK